jgi:hypothetical protein
MWWWCNDTRWTAQQAETRSRTRAWQCNAEGVGWGNAGRSKEETYAAVTEQLKKTLFKLLARGRRGEVHGVGGQRWRVVYLFGPAGRQQTGGGRGVRARARGSEGDHGRARTEWDLSVG